MYIVLRRYKNEKEVDKVFKHCTKNKRFLISTSPLQVLFLTILSDHLSNTFIIYTYIIILFLFYFRKRIDLDGNPEAKGKYSCYYIK